MIVWFDDTLSMKTLERGKFRWQLGVDELNLTLREYPRSTVELRRLSAPATAVRINPDDRDRIESVVEQWLTSPGRKTKLPPLPLQQGLNWLVTDGAGGGLKEWSEQADLAGILTIGSSTENSALTRLSLRPSLNQPSNADLNLQLSNLGRHSTVTELTLFADGNPRSKWEVEIPPGETLTHNTTLSIEGIDALEARLTATSPRYPDALADDDSLTIPLPGSEWLLPVALDPGCHAAVRRVVSTIPRLQPARSTAPQEALRISCTEETVMASGRPLIRIHTPRSANLLGGDPSWQPAANPNLRRLKLPDSVIRADSRTLRPGEEILLQQAGIPLITKHKASNRYDLWFDTGYPPLTARPEFPIMIAGILESAVGQPLIDGIYSVQREPSESRIIPIPLTLTAEAAATTSGKVATDPAGWLLLAAIGYLLIELFRIWRHDRGYLIAAPPPPGQDRP